MSNIYNKIRFIGYAIPTTPAHLVSIGDPNGPGAVAGTYLANSDIQADMSNRIVIMKNAVDTAKGQLPTGETDVINVFVAPEFYFHGTEGPYIYSAPSDLLWPPNRQPLEPPFRLPQLCHLLQTLLRGFLRYPKADTCSWNTGEHMMVKVCQEHVPMP
jgi:hypothetical protein